MLDGLFIVSLIGGCYRLIKESCEKPIPVENWRNKESMREDRYNGMSEQEIMKNVKNGKYIIKDADIQQYPKPHTNEKGQILIENCKLFNEDKVKYSIEQIYKWVKQGKYNLTPEELEKERKRLDEEYKAWLDKAVKSSMARKGLRYK